MSKASNARRKKLIYNVFRSDLSNADKMTVYSMGLKYIDGEQLLTYLDESPTIDQLREYIEARLKENRIKG